MTGPIIAVRRLIEAPTLPVIDQIAVIIREPVTHTISRVIIRPMIVRRVNDSLIRVPAISRLIIAEIEAESAPPIGPVWIVVSVPIIRLIGLSAIPVTSPAIMVTTLVPVAIVISSAVAPVSMISGVIALAGIGVTAAIAFGVL